MAKSKYPSVRAWQKKFPHKAVAARIKWYIRHCMEWDEELRKKRCRSLRATATKYGLLPKPNKCEVCGQTIKLQAHHNNYSSPIDVTWACIPCHILLDRLRETQLKIIRKKPTPNRLTPQDHDNIKALWAEGKSQVQIAKQLGCTNSAVSRIVNNLTAV